MASSNASISGGISPRKRPSHVTLENGLSDHSRVGQEEVVPDKNKKVHRGMSRRMMWLPPKVVASMVLACWLLRLAIEKVRMDGGRNGALRSGGLIERSKLADAVQNTPVGKLGPKGTNRHRLRYYDSLFYTAVQYGADAKSAIEVGCASDPFLRYLEWIEKKTCVAPYFVEYAGKGKDNTETAMESVTADFMEYELPNGKKFDLLLCSQVLEHVPDPAAFTKKLISSAKTAIISVPYRWKPCGKLCNHLTDNISEKTMLEWSAPHKPIYSGIVTESQGKNPSMVKRIILVYKSE